ncbi:MAG: hypothetical protein KDA97_01290 [Acidimicrobiales bacterium]|nr:hypothetical protein [Acidimicrobiales bacterium]
MITASLAPTSTPERIVVELDTDHEGRRDLWWEVTSGPAPPVPQQLEAVAIALVARAMSYRQDLHVAGPVSATLLANLAEFVDAWCAWRPDLFGPVAISADDEVDDLGAPRPLAHRAVAAFSGGLDSTWTLAAHRRGLLGHRSRTVVGAVLVQGFDVGLGEHEAFERARASAAAITGELGVPLTAVRTNWKEVAATDWEMTFGTATAAILHLFADRAGTAIMAADNSYARLTLPWGSNPITSPLLTSGRMALTWSGAGRTRTDKARLVAELPAARRHLRVCWQGPDHGGNCGRCEKCVRTKLNLLTAGVGEFEALAPLAPGQVEALDISADHVQVYYRDLLAEGLPEPHASTIAALLDAAGVGDP